MSGVVVRKVKTLNDKRRENKKRIDLLKNKIHKHEVNHVFNTLYRDQVAALYRELTRGKK